ncbi:MAG: hypothetical protein IJY19_11470 [Ruminococcus sp.]|nr:hypothetical protein [Ruminococcus sp.]
MSGGHLCAAEAPTEPTGEIHFLRAQQMTCKAVRRALCGVALYEYTEESVNKTEIMNHIINFMLYGALREKPELNVSIIYQNIDKSGLTYLNREYVKELLDEYQSKGTVSIYCIIYTVMVIWYHNLLIFL